VCHLGKRTMRILGTMADEQTGLPYGPHSAKASTVPRSSAKLSGDRSSGTILQEGCSRKRAISDRLRSISGTRWQCVGATTTSTRKLPPKCAERSEHIFERSVSPSQTRLLRHSSSANCSQMSPGTREDRYASILTGGKRCRRSSFTIPARVLRIVRSFRRRAPITVEVFIS
jgi:hypothetical protein